ncbi:MAG: hypothetical protein WCG47_08695, partial [Dermatophilaceae bacterium]
MAHVTQQRQGPVGGTGSGTGSGLSVSDPSDRLEQAAEATAARVMAAPTQREAGTSGGAGRERDNRPGTVAGRMGGQAVQRVLDETLTQEAKERSSEDRESTLLAPTEMEIDDETSLAEAALANRADTQQQGKRPREGEDRNTPESKRVKTWKTSTSPDQSGTPFFIDLRIKVNAGEGPVGLDKVKITRAIPSRNRLETQYETQRSHTVAWVLERQYISSLLTGKTIGDVVKDLSKRYPNIPPPRPIGGRGPLFEQSCERIKENLNNIGNPSGRDLAWIRELLRDIVVDYVRLWQMSAAATTNFKPGGRNEARHIKKLRELEAAPG